MKAYVKPCITRREMGYCGMVDSMHRYANCIIGVESGMYGYQQTGVDRYWLWDSSALIMLDTEEKYEKFKRMAKREY